MPRKDNRGTDIVVIIKGRGRQTPYIHIFAEGTATLVPAFTGMVRKIAP